VAEVLASAVRIAREEHPGLQLQATDFAAYVAHRLPGYGAVEVELARLHAADLFLAMGCAEGDPHAVRTFDRDFLPLADAAGRKLRLDDAGCDELRQQVRMKLLVGSAETPPKIANFAGTGALRSWVYATALRTGLNELRRIGRAPVPAGDEQLLVAMPDSGDDQELRYMKALYQNEFKRAFKAAIASLEDRLANVLRHYYLDDMTLEEIGRLYRVHKTTVMRWVNRAHALLEAETKRGMIEHLQLQPSEVESVLRLIQSGIQLGLHSVLAQGDREA
jgi:RNA polymerase sigma-70 factor (ECF subfamily)